MKDERPIKQSNKETAMRINNESITQLKTSKLKEAKNSQEDGDRQSARQTETRTDQQTDMQAGR